MCNRIRERGFSLLELLVVMGIISIMLAIVVPNIFEWLRFYRLRAAAQEVTGELQTARMQAVMKNTRLGVTLFVVDSNSYRWVNLDLADNPLTLGDAAGPLRDLPQDIVFDVPSQAVPLPGGVSIDGLRFGRLGAVCAQDVDQNCDAPATLPACAEARCSDNTTTTVRMVSVAGVTQVGLLNQRNGLTRALTINRAGRVEGQ